MAKGNDRPLSAFERAVASAIGDERPLGCSNDPAQQSYPLLWQWLSTSYVGKDKIKTPAVLTVRLGPGGVLASLTDRDLAVTVEVCCAHLDNVLQETESQLGSSNPIIRSWGRKEPQLRRRRGG